MVQHNTSFGGTFCFRAMYLLFLEFISSLFFSFFIPMCLLVRGLGYRDETEKKPSHVEMVTVQATAGMVAGACSSVITTPIDTVKTRLQVYIISCFVAWSLLQGGELSFC